MQNNGQKKSGEKFLEDMESFLSNFKKLPESHRNYLADALYQAGFTDNLNKFNISVQKEIQQNPVPPQEKSTGCCIQ